MEKDMHIGQLIEQRRKELSMTKVELARRIGVSRQYMGMIIFRKKLHQLDIIQKICVALNCDFLQHYALQSNDEIKKIMQSVIDQKQHQIDEFQKQLEEMKKMIEEKNFVIDVLRGKR